MFPEKPYSAFGRSPFLCLVLALFSHLNIALIFATSPSPTLTSCLSFSPILKSLLLCRGSPTLLSSAPAMTLCASQQEQQHRMHSGLPRSGGPRRKKHGSKCCLIFLSPLEAKTPVQAAPKFTAAKNPSLSLRRLELVLES